MPITWVIPQSGEPFGPGFLFSADSDVSGPFEPGTWWDIELTAPANENLVGSMRIPYLSNSATVLTWWNGTLTQSDAIHPIPAFVTGQSAQIRLTLEQPTFGVADTDTLPVTMDMQTGQTEELKQFLRQLVPAAGHGLTTEEHEAVLQTNVGVIAMSGLSAIDLLGAVGSAIKSSPPFGWGSLSGAYTISGDGELPDLDALQDRYGVYWLATEIPAGLGHLHGNTEEYLLRIVQWRATHIVGGTEMVTELADFNWHGGLWRFSGTRPERIEYSILPGVTLEARWWQFP